MNVVKIKRGCGSWECGCAEPHSIPFQVEGKVSSVKVVLRPAPKGVKLCAEKECQKILEMAGRKDVYAESFGQTKTKQNLVKACFEAIKKLSEMKVKEEFNKKAGIVGGRNE